MMKMKNMMKNDDYSSSSYNSDNAFDMFSDMFDSYEQKDNYRSSSEYKNPMGRMSQFKNMFNSMRFKRAAGDNLDLQAMKRDIQKYTMPSEWFKNKYEHLLDTCY